MKSIMIKQTIFAVAAGFLLSACGGGGGSSSGGTTPPPDATTPPGGTTPPSGGTTPPTVIQVPQCGTATDLGKSNTIDVTGKTIKKVANGAKVRIWHDTDGRKSACMLTGEATIK